MKEWFDINKITPEESGIYEIKSEGGTEGVSFWVQYISGQTTKWKFLAPDGIKITHWRPSVILN